MGKIRSLYNFYESGATETSTKERASLVDEKLSQQTETKERAPLAEEKFSHETSTKVRASLADGKLSRSELRKTWLKWIKKNTKLPEEKGSPATSRHSLMWVNFLPPSDSTEQKYFFQLLKTDNAFVEAMIEALEYHHNYVQWFFPTKKKSEQQPQEPFMDQIPAGKTDGDQAKFQKLAQDTPIKKLFLARIKLMLWFYGFDPLSLEKFVATFLNNDAKEQEEQEKKELKTKEETLKCFNNFASQELKTTAGPRVCHFDQRINVWPVIRRKHNLPRCTRLIESLIDVGEPHWAGTVFTFIMHTALNDPVAFQTIPANSLEFWVNALRKNPHACTSLKLYAGLVGIDAESTYENAPVVSVKAFHNLIMYRNTLESDLDSCWACFYTSESVQRKNVKIEFLNHLICHLPHANSRDEVTEIVAEALRKDPDRALAGISSNVEYYLKKAFPWLDLVYLQAEAVREKNSGMSLL